MFLVGQGNGRTLSEPPPLLLHPDAAYHWMEVALEMTARDVVQHGARPTVGSRDLAIVATAMFDAWAAYDSKAVGTRSGGTLRRPVAERTTANKSTAIAYAAYRVLCDVYPEEADYAREQLRNDGHDPADTSTDPTTPQGIGNQCAQAIIEYRHHDGANQLGDEAGGNDKPYADYTGYKCVNTVDHIVDLNRWQPIVFQDGKGGTVTPGYLTPQWRKVRTFALQSSDQFRPLPPPRVGSEEMKREVKEILSLNSHLTPPQKAIVEFMRDGPRSTGQSGHWLWFAQAVSRRDHFNLDQDVKLYFAVANVAMDAFIAAWDAKSFYDTSRPYTLVHTYYKGKTIRAWAGPSGGTKLMKGEDWRPFSPSTFVTPPFPGYVSGHSCVSAACAEALRLFTGSDWFGMVVCRKAGELTEPGHETPASLPLPTFRQIAEMAGESRVLGGYHIQADNQAGLKLGQQVALYDWQTVDSYYDGTHVFLQDGHKS